ncbi:MAG: hypothetical protein ACLPKE_06755 [Streptosporangiaceae bacterium]
MAAGVDGSPSSMSALGWAIRQTGRTGAAVDAVIAPDAGQASGRGVWSLSL